VPPFDVVGIGLNATDTLILVPHFPAYAGKVAFEREILSPGGQVASALATCARLGMRTKYIGTVGDDERGRIQLQSLRDIGINLDDVEVRENCPNQTAYIVIDQSTGERTVLWNRDDRLRLSPESISEEKISNARVLHVDYLIASSDFPTQWTSERDPFRALELIQEEYGMRVAGMTLGSYGALARSEGRFIYSPAFVVNCVDTTGAGDVFHGAFCYAVFENMPLGDALEFSNAMAALNCTALGARGGISTIEAARALMERGERRSQRDFEQRV
jgi:sulfofructose kinase